MLSLIVPTVADSSLAGDKPHSEDKPLRSAFFLRACLSASTERRGRQVTNAAPGRFRIYRPKDELGDVPSNTPFRVSPHRALSVRSAGISQGA
jgi:hypothetical protein